MTAHPTDSVLAINDLVEQAQRHQNDLAEFLDLHTEDASIVNLAGRRVLGKRAIHDAMYQALQSPLTDVITTAEVDNIRFVRPDVAVVSCTKLVFDHRDESLRDGAETSVPSAGRLTYVVVADQGRWRIASAQTTPIMTA
jgi:uncharacterized protein (TIGR02246 family)